MTMHTLPSSTPSSALRPVSLLVCALGGEGGGVLTEWLVEAARQAGFAAQSTSIPGVAQRTGATTYYLEVFPVPLAALGGRRPVFSLGPVPGMLDGLVSSELLETARQGTLGLPSPERTLVITSSARTLTTQERMALGDGRNDVQELLAVVRATSRAHHVLDMAGMAQAAGTMASAVMLGAVAASGLLPMPRSAYEAAIGAKASASLRGFDAGWKAVATPTQQAAQVQALLAEEVPPPPQTPELPAELRAQFPAPVHPMLALGHARMLEYQGVAYARLYVERLQQVLQAERHSDPQGANDFATTAEMARWLALWMAFDDIVRVADLKSRASRWRRVQREVKAAEGDLLRLYDHFKPGVPEFAAMLPAAMSNRLTAWDRRRQSAGKTPWALPLKVGTHSVFGMLSLRLLASLRALRPHGQRYAQEQALITQWLDSVVAGTREHGTLGHEIARCGQLIKGYGSTNERGKHNLLHIIGELATGPAPAPQRAQAVAAARVAALADEAGTALDEVLLQRGARARPVAEQPIRWMKKPRLAAGASKAG